jgi:hypothetical protein
MLLPYCEFGSLASSALESICSPGFPCHYMLTSSALLCRQGYERVRLPIWEHCCSCKILLQLQSLERKYCRSRSRSRIKAAANKPYIASRKNRLRPAFRSYSHLKHYFAQFYIIDCNVYIVKFEYKDIDG